MIVGLVHLLFGACCFNTHGFQVRTTTKGRAVWGWVQHDKVEVASLQLEAHPELFDGVYLICGLRVNDTSPGRPSLYLDTPYTEYECANFRSTMQARGVTVQMGLSVTESSKVVPIELGGKVDMSGIIESSIALATEHGWDGFNFDDESEGCPRKDPVGFRRWLAAVDEWGSALREKGLDFTVDVQALTCTACSPWPACLPAHGEPLTPALELALADIRSLLANSSVHRWIEMDTYYNNLDFFKENVNWYTKSLIDASKLGLGVCPNHDCNPTDDNQTAARFEALERTSITHIDVWRLPLDEDAVGVWLPRLQTWKRR